MTKNQKISVVIAGVRYKEFDIKYTVDILREYFNNPEIILSTNDKLFAEHYKKNNHFDKVIFCENEGELPSLKFPDKLDSTVVNNNINKQISCCYLGIKNATYPLVMKLRTDQIILNNDILALWSLIDQIPQSSEARNKRVITSSVFSINPRYSERMPFHISDMFQFGYKEDLLNYYSAPAYPFKYSIWYEKNIHRIGSNRYEKAFRSKYAVEQWLALHYIYKNERDFPIAFHNDHSEKIVDEFESVFPEYFIVAHPDDIGLRVSKFESARSYFNTQCYSTYESIELLKKIHPDVLIKNVYKPKGISKDKYRYIRWILGLKIVQLAIKNIPFSLKEYLKKKFLT
ncbi:WavE lipopolysaccharide synthesis family protein [Pantoea stewartii]|uniref:WavE lipopolysaccharide synthesis family protein n=1 Tax=Pantoea stewartii TaxID=66269 RepID=UPI0019824B86|nr:WavE lipopolysaccharide synthesis family protein [Pantoea stewartii]